MVTGAGQRLLDNLRDFRLGSGASEGPYPQGCLELATLFWRPAGFDNMAEARLYHLVSGQGTDAPGAQGGYVVMQWHWRGYVR